MLQGYIDKISGLNTLIDSLLLLSQIENTTTLHSDENIADVITSVIHEQFDGHTDRIQTPLANVEKPLHR